MRFAEACLGHRRKKVSVAAQFDKGTLLTNVDKGRRGQAANFRQHRVRSSANVADTNLQHDCSTAAIRRRPASFDKEGMRTHVVIMTSAPHHILMRTRAGRLQTGG